MLESGKRMSRRYPSRPVVGVGAIITEGPRVLLVRRGREPSKGLWSIPGGMLELGESLVDGIRREVREEVGLDVRVLETVEVLERIIYDDDGKIEYHYVLVDYVCEPLSGTLQVADDADAAEWVNRRDVSRYEITKGTAGRHRKGIRGARRPCPAWLRSDVAPRLDPHSSTGFCGRGPLCPCAFPGNVSTFMKWST